MEKFLRALFLEKSVKEWVDKVVELFNPKKAKWNGIPTLVFLFMIIVSAIVLFVPDSDGLQGGYVRSSFLVIMALLAVFGILFGEIGDRIPIWNKFVGGGTILVFFLASLAGTYGIFPEVFAEEVSVFYNGGPVRFLEIFIPALIVGSVLTVNRKILLKSVVGYVPLILLGVIGASLLGIGAGLLFGKAPMDVISNYVLPIMGGGTGAGAVPMSEMYEGATGNSAENWFAFAISILTIANIFAIIIGGLLNGLGEVIPSLTGNGQLIRMGEDEKIEKEEWEDYKSGNKDFAAALFFTGIMFVFSHFLAELWSTHLFDVLGFELHRLAILVILVILMNSFNLAPASLKAGAKSMQQFFVKNTLWVLMAAVGMSTDFEEIRAAFTLSNAIIAFAIVFGAVIAIMITARLFKFYAIEAAITAGLCMANRGGSGDIAVLGAANRMDLISFAQISSRVGGAIMLIIASVVFAIFG